MDIGIYLKLQSDVTSQYINIIANIVILKTGTWFTSSFTHVHARLADRTVV